MKKNCVRKSVICLLFAVLLFCSAAGNVSAGSVSEAQEEKEALENQLEEARELIDSLSDSREDLEDNVQALDEKLTEISDRVTALETQLAEMENRISDTQEDLTAAQADVDSQYESMKLRIRFLYENSLQSVLEVLLSAENFADFLNRAEYIRQISEYDRNMLAKYQNTVEQVANLETTLSEERTDLAALKEQVQEEQEAVAALLGEKENQLAQLGEELTDAEQLAQVYEAEIQAQNEIIAMIQAEEARKQAEEEAKKEQENSADPEDGSSQESGADQGSGTGGGSQETETPSFGGIFTWPCPASTRVTSDYGPRESPTAGASTYHRGIDIGAPYGSDIVAAADGVVSFTGYSSSSGNYLTIDHGDGIYTVYMHCSSIVAEKGDVVSAGDVVAKVGSTGISTGNHLHFGVSKDGSYVNPWEYLKYRFRKK